MPYEWTHMLKFSELALDPKVQKAVTEAGYDIPTPIQAQAIPHALEGRDVLGIAQTGTGKTAGFTLPLVTLLSKGRARARMPRSLVLCPTRELAAQVAESFDTYAKYTKLTKALLIGGVSFGEQDKLIDRGVDVLIATPGRLLDHFERGKLLLTGVQIMVVDEADRMLDMGFIPDIERIFQLTPFHPADAVLQRHHGARDRADHQHLPDQSRADRGGAPGHRIGDHRPVAGRGEAEAQGPDVRRKAQGLRELIRAEGAACTNAIVFCNRKVDVDVVAKSLKQHGFNASPIHGDLDQSVRTRTLDGFRDGSLHLLIASDVAARGLDIPAVSHVFNFDVPSHPEDYIHRIGRTGRAGRSGKAITLLGPNDAKYLGGVEALIGKPIPRVAVALAEGTEPAAAEETAEERPARRSRSRGPRRGEKPESAAHEPAAAAPAASEPVAAQAEPAEAEALQRRDDSATPAGPAAGVALHAGAVAHQRVVAAFAAGVALVALHPGLGAHSSQGSPSTAAVRRSTSRFRAHRQGRALAPAASAVTLAPPCSTTSSCGRRLRR
jgi:superfamily II DNA/RNA helicase